ncbi:DUF6993 domain-containing protein [Microbacterium neungamense]|uniref:DUF6993 domain-containing protein n=1 Tax=Microbacterium neungamense TaxID=2810535 RepID=UPI00217E38DB|nr:hypothetical protein [Microbacterium neungamense]
MPPGSSAAAPRSVRPWRYGAVLALLLALTGCGQPAPDARDTAAPTAGASSVPPGSSAPPGETTGPGAAPPPAAEPPVLHPEGTAADNLPLFAHVTAGVWASEDRARGGAYIDALVAAGFDKARMQVTEDESTVGNPAESLQFSVAWHDGQCLIGQVGPSTGDPVTAVMPQLGDGRCLIGRTRPIDW